MEGAETCGEYPSIVSGFIKLMCVNVKGIRQLDLAKAHPHSKKGPSGSKQQNNTNSEMMAWPEQSNNT